MPCVMGGVVNSTGISETNAQNEEGAQKCQRATAVSKFESAYSVEW
jgi:hypothetical protein